MKYKYYFKKPRSEIVKDILRGLLVGGIFVVAAQSPYFWSNLLLSGAKHKKKNRRNAVEAFRRLRKQGYIVIEKRNRQIYVRLTPEGKKYAGWLQIDNLAIQRPKRWDGKWRLIMFDIAHFKKSYREMFRGKLKELGFYKLQKSVWACPFTCRDEVSLLKEFFGLGDNEVRYVTTDNIGDDAHLRRFFSVL